MDCDVTYDVLQQSGNMCTHVNRPYPLHGQGGYI